jgi:hypothetical protein
MGENKPEPTSGLPPSGPAALPGSVGTSVGGQPSTPAATAANAAAVPAAAASAASAADAKDPAIEALNLSGDAYTGAYALKKAHPAVTFTSGRRSKADQARAMASNVVNNRKWIEQTYAESDLRKACQKWVDDNPKKTTQAEIAAGLVSVFDGVTDEVLGGFSKHLSGAAFDVQPVTKDAEEIKKTIRGLKGLDKFLDTEGGLVRWHAQF